ncbi:MAG: type II toxin-antitoxin system RelE/ParE family toxin [Chloroflexota bacterium]|nr:type II toxin-antitoxin system RelE/ParE family toxin [Chloroflexota bacterium]
MPTFAENRTERLASGQSVPAFSGFESQAHRRLLVLRNTPTLAALGGLQSNRLESLKVNGVGQYSTRINDQWRISFEWPDGDTEPSNIQIVDYH